MKTALVTTTINVPEVLKLYRACDESVELFIAGDLKTPVIESASYLSPDWQKVSGYKCSDLIGWNTIGRRNIATLEALKWGADIIVTVDDDNIPTTTDYFEKFQTCFVATRLKATPPFGYVRSIDGPTEFNGLSVGGGWFDPGSLYEPAVKHRGFPFDNINPVEVSHIVGAKIGAAMGLVLGDCDVSAKTRMGGDHMRQMIKEVARAGVVVNPGTWTVLNTQNTAFLRQFAPCWLLPPQWKRFDDIFASMVAQRVMRDHGYVVHIGQPFVYQQRNVHDLSKDAKAEAWGEEHCVEFAEWLDRRQLPQTTVLEQVRYLYSTFADILWMPEGVSELGRAWCDDVEKVL